MTDDLVGNALEELRRQLLNLVAIADSGQRPRPDVINPPGHAMPGHEWRVDQRVLPGRRPPLWVVRTVDDEETRPHVYVAEPDRVREYDWIDRLDFTSMSTTDARRLAMALLAAADHAEHRAAGVPRLEDRRDRRGGKQAPR
jgi:hypothetical protein